MFAYARSFNQPLNHWNVSNVMDMCGMFRNATSFNQPLNDWNISKVTNMGFMFFYAASFNQPLDSSWNVGDLTGINQCMVADATTINKPIHSSNASDAFDLTV